MKAHFLLLLLCLLFTPIANGQNLLTKAGGPANDEALDIETDASGNSYITGYVGSIADFGSFSSTHLGSQDIFVAKINSSGDFLWVKSFGGTNVERGLDIALDNNGNLYLTGYFFGNANFGTTVLSSNGGSRDLFLAKINASNGNVVWALNEGGVDAETGHSVTCDNQGNVIVCGQFEGSLSVGANTYTTTINAGTGTLAQGILLIKYNSSGNLLWSKSGISSANNNALAIHHDASDNLYITGNFSEDLTIDGTLISNQQLNAGYIAKFQANGSMSWFRKIAANSLSPVDLKISSSNIYLTGNFQNNLIYYGANSTDTVYTSFQNNFYLLKVNSNGSFTWGESLGSNNALEVKSLGLNSLGDAFVTGTFECNFEEIRLNKGSALWTSIGKKDIFAVKYSGSGSRSWERHQGGLDDDISHGISLQGNNDPIICGQFKAPFYVAQSSTPNFPSYISSSDELSLNGCGVNAGLTSGLGLDILIFEPYENASQPEFNYYEDNSGACTDSIPSFIIPDTDTIEICNGLILNHQNNFMDMGPPTSVVWNNLYQDDSIADKSVNSTQINGVVADGTNTHRMFTINAGAGADELNFGTGTYNSGANPTDIAGLPAVDGIDLTDGLDRIHGDILINGQGDSDTVNIDDSGNTQINTGYMTSSMIAGLSRNADNVNDVSINYHEDIENLNLFLGQNNDRLFIEDTFRNKTNIVANGGDDAILADNLSGKVNIEGDSSTQTVTEGADHILVKTVTGTDAGFHAGAAAYTTTITADSGDDIVDIHTVEAGMGGVTISGEEGDDIVRVENVHSKLTINGDSADLNNVDAGSTDEDMIYLDYVNFAGTATDRDGVIVNGQRDDDRIYLRSSSSIADILIDSGDSGSKNDFVKLGAEAPNQLQDYLVDLENAHINDASINGEVLRNNEPSVTGSYNDGGATWVATALASQDANVITTVTDSWRYSGGWNPAVAGSGQSWNDIDGDNSASVSMVANVENSGNLDHLRGFIHINGDDRNEDYLEFNDDQVNRSRDFVIEDDRLSLVHSAADIARITYENISDFNLFMSEGNDRVDIASTHRDTDYFVLGASGNDTFNLGSTTDLITDEKASADGYNENVLDHLNGFLRIDGNAGYNRYFITEPADFNLSVDETRIAIADFHNNTVDRSKNTWSHSGFDIINLDDSGVETNPGTGVDQLVTPTNTGRISNTQIDGFGIGSTNPNERINYYDFDMMNLELGIENEIVHVVGVFESYVAGDDAAIADAPDNGATLHAEVDKRALFINANAGDDLINLGITDGSDLAGLPETNLNNLENNSDKRGSDPRLGADGLFGDVFVDGGAGAFDTINLIDRTDNKDNTDVRYLATKTYEQITDARVLGTVTEKDADGHLTGLDNQLRGTDHYQDLAHDNFEELNVFLGKTDDIVHIEVSDRTEVNTDALGDAHQPRSLQGFNNNLGQNNTNFFGGSGDDSFVLSDSQYIRGSIDGEAGLNDRLDYHLWQSSIVANLKTGRATGINTGYDGGLALKSRDGEISYSNQNDVDQSSIEHITGGEGDDFIYGSDLKNVLIGGGGDDSIYGYAGDDRLIGDYDDDFARYNDRNNAADLTSKADLATDASKSGDDLIVGGAGNDDINGGIGSDNLQGGVGNDIYRLYDNPYELVQIQTGTRLENGVEVPVYRSEYRALDKDLLTDTEGTDMLDFSQWNTYDPIFDPNSLRTVNVLNPDGTQKLDGTGQPVTKEIQNIYKPDSESALGLREYFDATTQEWVTMSRGITLDLQAGDQTVHAKTGQSIKLAGTFEHVIGTSATDKIFGNAEDNIILGRAGDDVINGRLGADTLDTGAGADFATGNGTEDTIYADTDEDRVTARETGTKADTVIDDASAKYSWYTEANQDVDITSSYKEAWVNSWRNSSPEVLANILKYLPNWQDAVTKTALQDLGIDVKNITDADFDTSALMARITALNADIAAETVDERTINRNNTSLSYTAATANSQLYVYEQDGEVFIVDISENITNTYDDFGNLKRDSGGNIITETTVLVNAIKKFKSIKNLTLNTGSEENTIRFENDLADSDLERITINAGGSDDYVDATRLSTDLIVTINSAFDTGVEMTDASAALRKLIVDNTALVTATDVEDLSNEAHFTKFTYTVKEDNSSLYIREVDDLEDNADNIIEIVEIALIEDTPGVFVDTVIAVTQLSNLEYLEIRGGSEDNVIQIDSLAGTQLERLKVELFAGDDLLNASLLNDKVMMEVYGDAGHDRITTGAAADKIYAGSGDDIVRGNAGQDIIELGSGFDITDAKVSEDNVTNNSYRSQAFEEQKENEANAVVPEAEPTVELDTNLEAYETVTDAADRLARVEKAEADLKTAQGEATTAQEELALANTELNDAQIAFDYAQENYDGVAGTQALFNQAQADLAAAKTKQTTAQNTADAKQAKLTAAEQELSDAQAALEQITVNDFRNPTTIATEIARLLQVEKDLATAEVNLAAAKEAGAGEAAAQTAYNEALAQYNGNPLTQREVTMKTYTAKTTDSSLYVYEQDGAIFIVDYVGIEEPVLDPATNLPPVNAATGDPILDPATGKAPVKIVQQLNAISKFVGTTKLTINAGGDNVIQVDDLSKTVLEDLTINSGAGEDVINVDAVVNNLRTNAITVTVNADDKADLVARTADENTRLNDTMAHVKTGGVLETAVTETFTSDSVITTTDSFTYTAKQANSNVWVERDGFDIVIYDVAQEDLTPKLDAGGKEMVDSFGRTIYERVAELDADDQIVRDENGQIVYKKTDIVQHITRISGYTSLTINTGSEQNVVKVEDLDGTGLTKLNVNLSAGDDVLDAKDVGSEIDMNVTASSGKNLILTGAGHDSVTTGSGNDTIITAAGKDTINAGSGHDRVISGAGTDTIQAGSGNDNINAGAGNDTVHGSTGDDTISGDAGNDIIYGEGGNDLIRGGKGDDEIRGGDNEDTLYGGEGQDRVVGGQGNDLMFGDEGDDLMFGDGNVVFNINDDNTIKLDAEGRPDYVVTDAGSGGDDIIVGGAGHDLIDGNRGNDLIFGDKAIILENDADGDGFRDFIMVDDQANTPAEERDGNDTLFGNNGDDRIFGSSGFDLLDGGTGNDYLDGGLGDDLIRSVFGENTVIAWEGNDDIRAINTETKIYGGFGNDEILVDPDTERTVDPGPSEDEPSAVITDFDAGEQPSVYTVRLIDQSNPEILLYIINWGDGTATVLDVNDPTKSGLYNMSFDGVLGAQQSTVAELDFGFVKHEYKNRGAYFPEIIYTFAAKDPQVNPLPIVTGNRDPEIAESFQGLPSRILVNTSFELNAAATNIGINNTLTYEWDLGDGTKLFGPNISHTYNRSGDYVITLTVTNRDGDVTTETFQMEVIPVGPKQYQPPGPLEPNNVDPAAAYNAANLRTYFSDEADVLTGDRAVLRNFENSVEISDLGNAVYEESFAYRRVNAITVTYSQGLFNNTVLSNTPPDSEVADGAEGDDYYFPSDEEVNSILKIEMDKIFEAETTDSDLEQGVDESNNLKDVEIQEEVDEDEEEQTAKKGRFRSAIASMMSLFIKL